MIEEKDEFLNVQCRICGRVLRLSKDSIESRELGKDPRTQLRLHLRKHAFKVVGFARNSGWLLDMLLFECPDDPAWWKKNIITVLDWLIKRGVREQ